MKPSVLLIEPTIRPAGVDLLMQEATVSMAPDGAEDTLISYINNHKCRAVLTRVEQITQRILTSCPTLEVVGQHGVGVDNIDVEAATQQGVAVIHVPGANFVSVAEHAMLLILACARRLVCMDRCTRSGDWASRNRLIPSEAMGKQVLLVGMGRQGQDMARKLTAFQMTPYGFDPFVSREIMKSHGVEKVDNLLEALPRMDFVSIHVPLTEETRHMFGKEAFAQMKNSAYLVNVGRGPVIDQAALVSALEEGLLAGAGLDVFDREPPDPSDPLLRLENVIVTPHIAGDTIESKDRCSRYLALDVLRALQGALPEGLYNKGVADHAKFLLTESRIP